MVAGVPRPRRLPRVPCFPEGVGGVERVAPPLTLASSDVGVFGASSAWLLEGVVVVVLGPPGCRARGVRFRPWVPGDGDLGCSPCWEHFLQWWVGVVGGSCAPVLPGVPAGLLSTQPLPGVPVDVVLAQPLPGVQGVCLRHLRRPVRLLLPGHQGLGVSTVLRGVEVQGGVCRCCLGVCRDVRFCG